MSIQPLSLTSEYSAFMGDEEKLGFKPQYDYFLDSGEFRGHQVAWFGYADGEFIACNTAGDDAFSGTYDEVLHWVMHLAYKFVARKMREERR